MRVHGLLERESAVAALRELVESARAGHGRSLFMLGDPGTGKTALVQLARQLADADMAVLSAHGVAGEGDFAFAYIEQILGTIDLDAPQADADPIELAGGRVDLVHNVARSQLREVARAGP